MLSVLVGGAFGMLLGAITSMRDAARLAHHSDKVTAIANDLERLVVDVETGQRGFLLTNDERFLQPWAEARARFDRHAAELQRTTAARNAGQGERAAQIARDGASYIREYSDPMVAATRRDANSARTFEAIQDGRLRMDGLREQFRRFGVEERKLAAERNTRAADTAHRSVVWALGGIAGSVLVVFGFGAYLARGVVQPVRRASLMAGELADGDLAVRMPETGKAEVGDLEHSFNLMAHSLEINRDGLRGLMEEQAALRRVATLVARAGQPSEVFDAVASELGRIQGADYAAIERYEPDDSATVVGSWAVPGAPGTRLPVGSRWSLEGESVAAMVLHTGRLAQMTSYEHAAGELAAWARDQGIRSSIGSPITVEGRLWGMMIAFWLTVRARADEVERRMSDFTELLATAIANAEGRAELTASRARVVAASDAARRRIERDLHDGTQQRLVSLGIDLRLAHDELPPELGAIERRLSRWMQDLTDIIMDLQEVSRGIHPAILSRGGLGPALKTLSRRSPISVTLNVNLDRRLAEPIEVAVYYVVSEALTNASKHANASEVSVDVGIQDCMVCLSVQDDGIGGADPHLGSGLIGLKDRVEALGGRLRITSPAGAGTTLLARIPMPPA